MNLQAWWIAFRPNTLIVSIAPVFLGLALTYNSSQHNVNWLIGSLTLMAAILIQIGTNLINDLYDFINGADDENRLGPIRVTQSGLLSKKQVNRGAFLSFFFSLLIGFYLVYEGGVPILLIGLFSLVSGYCYTAGPYPLGYNGFGDIFVFIFFGVIATFGTAYLQILDNLFLSQYFYKIFLLSISVGSLNTAILVVNNIRDYDSDKLSNKKTLAVRFGQKFTCYEYMFLLIINYTCYVLVSVLLNNFITLLIMLPIPILSILLIRKIFYYESEDLNVLLEKTAQFSFLNALLFFISIVI